MRGHAIIIGTLAAALMPPPALAQSAADEPAVSISYNAEITSDYRFRGISYSNRGPAVQGGVDLDFRSGLFLGMWGTTLADYGGANSEIDAYAGYGGSLAGFDYDAGVYVYLYPGGHGVDTFELQSSLSRTIGPVATKLTFAFTPDQKNTARDNLYIGLKSELPIPGTPLTATAGIGRENGGWDEKWDWSAGLAYQLDALEISARYVDSNEGGDGRGGFVAAVKAVF